MVDVKCKGCNKLVLKANVFIGAIKCHRCKMIFEYNVTTNTLHITNTYDSLGVERTDVKQI
ncbi:MAG: hypothetical protein WCJ60_01605 [bacterium]